MPLERQSRLPLGISTNLLSLRRHALSRRYCPGISPQDVGLRPLQASLYPARVKSIPIAYLSTLFNSVAIALAIGSHGRCFDVHEPPRVTQSVRGGANHLVDG